MEEKIKQLQQIIGKYKKNSKINKTEAGIATKILCELITNSSYMKIAFNLLSDLPDQCCIAVIDAWKQCDDLCRKNILDSLVTELFNKGLAGMKRSITLIREFLNVDEVASIYTLVEFSRQVTDGGGKMPSKRLVDCFRKELLENSCLMRINIRTNEIDIAGESGLAALALAGICSGKDMDVATVKETINWLLRNNIRPVLGNKVLESIEGEIIKWPVDIQSKCRDLLFPRTNPVNNLSINQQGMEGPWEETGPINNMLTHENFKLATVDTRERKAEEDIQDKNANFPAILNVEICIDWLVQYIRTLEKINKELKEKQSLIELECYQERNNRSALQDRLDALLTMIKQNESRINELQKEIEDLETRNSQLMTELHQERQHREQEVAKFRERVDLEHQYAIETFTNRLVDRLSRYYREYLKAKQKPPTEQLANYLQHLLDRVFIELGSNGVRLDGEEF